jgi:hypothetical protein
MESNIELEKRLRVEQQMADFEKSMPEATKHERKMIRAALTIFEGTLEFVPNEKPKHDNAKHTNLDLFTLLQGVERII